MAMSTTNNNMTTLMTSTVKSPLKHLHNGLAGMQLRVLPMPGIQDIKWVELYNKFWMLVPVEYHKDWFYFTTTTPMVTCEKVKANQKRQ